MLPADSAQRLVSLLTQALEECLEKQQQLQRELVRCGAVLGDWNLQAPDSPTVKDCSSDNQEREPSTEELEELELLNKALEKALKVRSKFLGQVPLRETAEGTKALEKKPVAHVAVKQQGANSKLVKMTPVAKSVKMTPVSQKPACPQKLSAYMLKAPYRTDPAVKRPQGKTSARMSCRLSKVYGKSSPKGAACPKDKSPVTLTGAEHGKISAAENPRVLPGTSESLQDAKQSSSLCNSTGGGDFASASPSFLGMEQHPSRESSPGMCTAPQTSTLQEKGLWEDGRLCQTSPEAATARDHFMEKLQVTFCSSSPSFSLLEVEKELTCLHGVYFLMSQYVETEVPASLGENPTWEREYEILLTLEGLQPALSQCLDKVCQLEEAVESHRQLFPADSAHGEADSSSAEGPFRWRQRTCGAEAFGPPPLLYYSSLKELQELEALKLQVATLHRQINIQKAMEGELLPLLEPGPAPQGSCASLYRAIYTLLCEGGERFPALVSEEELSHCLEP
ncbi:tubulin epsilon and delta complex protein 2 isoform X2 [Eublepharis macularius]|uniref:Tubulin epsilon and delta complex protein 2 isoform X2 n=1 Tax=Eublepharis macularius TaxID=481883 RepID=A0AA97K677_EUBMA|nr:tubulin epsilon and delta complex protein 2 isoform X2 [Eublepharis macularius]